MVEGGVVGEKGVWRRWRRVWRVVVVWIFVFFEIWGGREKGVGEEGVGEGRWRKGIGKRRYKDGKGNELVFHWDDMA